MYVLDPKATYSLEPKYESKKVKKNKKKNTQNWTGSTPFNKATLGSITKVIKGSSEPSWRF